MPAVTSLAKDLSDRSAWFFRAKDEDAPRRREIVERLRDLSKYVWSVPADDPQIRRWHYVERLIDRPLQPRKMYFDDVSRWGALADASTDDEALETFVTLRSEDMISFLLRLGADREAVLRKARAVDITPQRFDEICRTGRHR